MSVELEQRRQERLISLSMLAEATAQKFSDLLWRKYKFKDAIAFDKGALGIAMDAYWRLVEEFKKSQAFRAGARINSAKKAALTLFAIARSHPPIFKVSDDVDDLDVTYIVFAELLFAVELLYLYMKVRPGSVSRRHQSDLATCIWRVRKAPNECDEVVMVLLCLYADAWWHQGSAVADNSDDAR
jgi:hypothetical protein